MKILLFLLPVLAAFASIITAQNFWENKGLNGKTVYDITVDSVGNIYVATSDSGVYISTNNGISWQQSNTGLTSLNVWSIKATKNTSGYIFAATFDMGLFLSSDFGNSWIQSGLSEWVSEIESNSNGDIFTSTITDGIYRSTDVGNSWERVSDPMQVGNDVYSIKVSTNDDVFAGTDAYMFRSTDNGNTWIKINTGLVVTGVIWSIAFDSSEDVFAGDGGGFFLGSGSVYCSLNNGNSWSQTLMTDRSVIALMTIPVSTIYAGTDSGVYVSYDNGETGEQINSGLTASIVYSLSLDKTGYLFAGTNNGIFRSVESVTSVDEEMENLPSNFLLNQNYPNPFNPSTKISWQSPVGSWQTLKVYDILGNEIATLVDEYKPAGIYEVEFSAIRGSASGGNTSTIKHKPSTGVYLCRLKIENKSKTIKMIYLK